MEAQVTVGDQLPELRVALTPTFVISSALATRDYTPVHHDVAIAQAQGSKDIFLNILTTMGLLERFVTDWAGPGALIHGMKVKLGVPAYAGDTLTLTGAVSAVEDARFTVDIVGSVSLGAHAQGSVRLSLPR
ncbi:acyl dehydratase [Streptosporangiaceae bacterium NEAU-GS5]|nr:acyl dehydratase [Streptosporangiaceae bacterium NEAU-GS5]